ncbi:small ribosomal subunit protein uS8 isoform X2 [Bos javanicus]|uniref:small ribosomal subunit protein uS8 isoform X2 n=1 Tax=Bos javanicus TaxID=9906 RepID=UPI002AA768EA|nr:small ribosomal subunit protein uS8 isoform X2 [Bos javanicus]
MFDSIDSLLPTPREAPPLHPPPSSRQSFFLCFWRGFKSLAIARPVTHNSVRSPLPSSFRHLSVPCGVISPRFDVQLKDLEKWQNNLLPSRQFGFIVLTTSAGIMDHEEARRKHTGGKILGFFF